MRITPILSEEDADLSAVSWYNKKGYAWRCPRRGKNDRRIHYDLHRVVLSRMLERPLTSEDIVDHINGNKLDCRRANLRLVSSRENKMNLHTPRNKWGFFGVRKSGRKFYASIQVNGEHILLGGFDLAIEAARAYDAGAERHGFLTRNFGRTQPCGVVEGGAK